MIMFIEGGIRMPSVPPAANVPRNNGSLYLCLSISPIATTPIVAAVATLEPETEPNKAQAPTLECINPPGSHDIHCTRAPYMRPAMPLRSRISPNMM